MESITLKSVQTEKNKIIYLFSVSEGLKKLFLREEMFVEYDFDISEIPESILVLPFVANMLPVVWITNSVLWVKEVDLTFYKSQFIIKKGFEEMYSHYQFGGSLIPAKLIENTYEVKREAVVLFSGGIDANTTLARTIHLNPILMNIYGWFDDKTEYNAVCEGDRKDIELFSEDINLDTEFARSNFAKVVNTEKFDKEYKVLGNGFWGGFQHGTAFISIASIVAYHYGVKNVYIASSNTFGFNKPCGSDPRIDAAFEFATEGRAIHDGYELCRQKKVETVVAFQKSLDNSKNFKLRVCSFNDRNCLECEKCFRTTVELVAEGADLEKFDLSVDGDLLEHWKAVFNKTLYCFPVRFEDSYYWYETRERMKENYENIKEKEFVDWFLTYDFYSEQKKALLHYRITNFFKILSRRIKEKLVKN